MRREGEEEEEEEEGSKSRVLEGVEKSSSGGGPKLEFWSRSKTRVLEGSEERGGEEAARNTGPDGYPINGLRAQASWREV